MIFEINQVNSDPKEIDIQAGDWIDIFSSMNCDPAWGYSVLVTNVDEFDQIWVNYWNGTAYEETTMSPYWIVDNYRKVPYEE